MFSKLKEKLKNWTKKVSKIEEEKVVELKPKKIEKEIHLEPSLDNQLRGETVIRESKKKEVEKETKKKAEELIEEVKKETPKGIIKKIGTKIKTTKISEKEFEIYSEELQNLLLENNVALEVAEKMVQELKEEVIGKELLKNEIEEEIKDAFKNIIKKILIDPFNLAEKIKQKNEPYVILFVGINGCGKTTTIAKVADNLQKKGISCVLAAGDTFRAASIEQLKNHGEKLGIKVISHEYGSDPAAVGFDAIKYAKKNFIKCVLIDTAGRMHTSKDLLREIEKITKVTNPDLKIFIGESITGNDAIEQAKSFNWSIGIDGIILTKADIDEKGGTSLSVGYVLKKPILYLGTGQVYGDIEPFDKEKFIKMLGL